MLETSEERVKLLKAGINGKEIEKMYINFNGFRIISGRVLYNIPSFSPSAPTSTPKTNDNSIIQDIRGEDK